MKKKHWVVLTVCSLAVIYFLTSGKNKPSKAHPVTDFDLTKYLGKWYEIARFDYRFEKHLNNTTAQYNLNEDGTVKVINRGYNFKKKSGKSQKGRRYFYQTEISPSWKFLFLGLSTPATTWWPSKEITSTRWWLEKIWITSGYSHAKRAYRQERKKNFSALLKISDTIPLNLFG